MECYNKEYLVTVPTAITEQKWNGCYNGRGSSLCIQRGECDCKHMMLKGLYCVSYLPDKFDLSVKIARESKKVLFGRTLIDFTRGMENVEISPVILLKEKDMPV